MRYVDRDVNGKIKAVYGGEQYPGQETVVEDDPELVEATKPSALDPDFDTTNQIEALILDDRPTLARMRQKLQDRRK